MTEVKVKIIADTVIKGEPVFAGSPDNPTIVSVSAADAATLIAYSKAARYSEPPEEISDETLAAALEKAKLELLDKIASAATVEELDALLSEDDAVIAAYEMRLAELTKNED